MMIKRIVKKFLIHVLLFVRGIIYRITTNKEVAVACIARLEGHYIREFVEHYKSLGFSKCIVADNNRDDDPEDLSIILKDYIDEGFVIYEDYRNKVAYQMKCYAELYQKYRESFFAIAFFDCDEFLVLPNHDNIYDFLKNKCQYDCVVINWLCYGDNNHVYADYSKPLNERFTEPCPIDTKVQYDFSENRHIKSIIICRSKSVAFPNNPHIPGYQKLFYICNSDGKRCDISPFQPINYKNAYLKHFVTKSLQEWVEKLRRGGADQDYKSYRSHYPLDRFFKYNSMTKEKQEFLDTLKPEMYKWLYMDSETKKKPFVSVIIPNYCHSRYLDERLTSVLNQTYPYFEIIILDDCSPDDGASRAVIEKYRDNPYVSHIVYNEVNSGSPFRQWQKGFSLAKGDYIWIAESDDSCDCRLLEVLTKPLIDNSRCVLSFCRSITIDSEGNKTGVIYPQKGKDAAINMDGRALIFKEMKFYNLVNNASSAIFRKDILSEIKQDYIDYKACGDWLFWIYIMEHGDVSYTPLLLNYRRIHDTNTTQKCLANGISDHELFLVSNFLHDQNYLSKRELMRIKIARYVFRKYTCPFENKDTELACKKEWGFTAFTWLIVKYDHLLDKIIKMANRLII